MPITTGYKNTLLDASPPAYLSLHTASPGSTGANELTTAPYARKAATWATASGGSKALSNSPVFDVAAGTYPVTVSHVGFWTAVTGGTFLGYYDITDETYSGQGTMTVASGSIDLNAVASA